MLTDTDPVFIVDMNEIEDGKIVPVSLDFTVNYGPFKRGPIRVPAVGDWVKVHSDDDNLLYFGKVVARDANDRDLTVEIDWQTCAPVLNPEWSARPLDAPPVQRVWLEGQQQPLTASGAGH